MIAVKKALSNLSHLFFPHICAGCGTDVLNHESPICIRCIDQLPVTNFHLYAGNVVEKHFWGRIDIHGATSFCHFTKSSVIQRLLHQLKYKNNKEIGYFLGQLMGKTISEASRFSDVDILVPLPLFAARERKRGYNQAAVLCDGMAVSLKIPVATTAVVRLSATETQTHKNRIERWQNMQGMFRVNEPAAITGKHVLLVDDVVTTGATLEACGQELLQYCSRLSVATLAHTV
jgi:ComF family protein